MRPDDNRRTVMSETSFRYAHQLFRQKVLIAAVRHVGGYLFNSISPV